MKPPRVAVLDSGQRLDADYSRLALELFLPGEDTHEHASRVSEIAERVLALPDDEVAATAARIVEEFRGGVNHLTDVLAKHAATVASHRVGSHDMSPERAMLMGAAFTREYAVEGAALCNPSAVPHPDQSGLAPGQLRVAVALRAIGEGHISSIEFASAVIGPGIAWKFDPRQMPLIPPAVSEPRWVREHFEQTVAAAFGPHAGEVVRAIIRALPESFTPPDLEKAIAALPAALHLRHDAREHLDRIHVLVESAYRATFPEDSELSQRILMPVSPDESGGMEDARFVLCTYPDGERAYRATYTAYNRYDIEPRLIISPDLRTFEMHRLAGPAAHNKGIALFPRHVGGKLYALTRSDGETLGIAQSEHGRVWGAPAPLHTPSMMWEIIQAGNCGSPIETEAGWLVLTHGVAPMRRYSIGCLLLDLEDPTKVRAVLEQPLIEPGADREGYVPNVVYSCGGLAFEGRLWLPYGIGDNRVRVASVDLAELLGAMTPVG